MSYQTEDEQIEKIKEVWHRHGVPVLTGVVLALAGVFGWNGWTNFQETKAANASAVYQNMLESVLQDDSEAGRTRGAELAETLRKDYPGTRYASFAALMQARLAVEAEDFAAAETLLRDVAEDGSDEALQEVARQRLARVLAQLERAEEGLELFSSPVSGELLAGREEVRGDLLLTLGRVEDARLAYQAALDATSDPRARPQLQLKLDDLAEEAS
ncbi:YfgM family protein [Pseudomonas sp. FME51]|uniref:YfgM family protein n=1 Tax=Pseudomonas sp. FME51 TaxID=2742609 RepID=UPI0018677ED4|nr:tetratricopeptide repeat protein [Pseudomonas sp. FME51]